MDFTELASKRYSVRDYSDKPVSDDILTKILEAGMLSPTARNIQPQRIYVIKSEEGIQKARSLSKMAFNAPIILMFTYDKEEAWKNAFTGEVMGITDVSIVMTHVMLKASELGLGTCWIGYFDPVVFAKEYNIPDSERLVYLMTLGYPSDVCEPSPMHNSRKNLKDLTKYL